MRSFSTQLSIFAVVAAGCVIAACSSTSGPGTTGSIPGAASRRGASPLVLVSTNVKFYNSGPSTIYGSGSATCWSTSPSPLPSIGPDAYSGIVTLSYDTTCLGGPNHLDITYSPASGTPGCMFVTTYSDGKFTYEAVNNLLTACTATPSANAAFQELYSYDPAGSLHKHR